MNYFNALYVQEQSAAAGKEHWWVMVRCKSSETVKLLDRKMIAINDTLAALGDKKILNVS